MARAALLCAGISLLPLVGSGAGLKGWKTYKNQDLGFSLRYPPSMAAYTGDQAASGGLFKGTNKPDVRFTLPVPYDESHIYGADVAVFADREGFCSQPPSWTSPSVLAGRQFRRYSDSTSGGTGSTIEFEVYSTVYRQKCLSIMIAIQTYRYDDPRTPQEWERTETLRQAAKALLIQVVHSLELLGPSHQNE